MKRTLLALLVIGLITSAAMAGDTKMKTLLVGTWRGDCKGETLVFQPDGKQIVDGDNTEKWDIKDGLFIEIPPDENRERPAYFKILLLTKHEFLAQETSHGNSYLFYWRKDE